MTTDVTPQGLSEIVGRPKLDGNRVALRGRVFPDHHRRATLQARARGLSLSDYLMELIDRDSATQPAPRASTQGVLHISA